MRAARAVVLEGEAGLGKTTLFEAALRETSARVLRCRPAPAETQLAFAALTDLLADVPLPELPGPQRRALEVALQRRGAGAVPPDVRAIAGGFLGTLRALEPVVVAIDDAQWLDAPSRGVLEFALRRFDGRVLVAQRPGGGGLGLTNRITLGPLEPNALHELLDARGFALPRPALLRLHERSGGNPFHALQLASGRALKVDALPEPARELAERVALLYDRTLVRELAAPGALDAAVAAGVLEVSGARVAFAHPLIAEAARQGLGPEREASLHSELAEIETGEARALHLALATWTPSAAIADELVQASQSAARRGGAETAARLLEHAARLDPERAARHQLAAAEHHVAAGDPQRALALLAELSGAEALSLRSWLSADLETGVQLAEQAVAEAGDNVRLIAVTRQRLCSLERIRGNHEASAAHGCAAVAGARQVGDKGLEALALASLGLTRYIRDRRVGDELRRAAQLERELPEFLGQQAPSVRLGFALLANNDFDEARGVFTEASERALAAGHEDARAIVLSYLVDLEYRSGNWARARVHARDALELSRQASSAQERNAVAGTVGSAGGRPRERRDGAADGARRARRRRGDGRPGARDRPSRRARGAGARARRPRGCRRVARARERPAAPPRRVALGDRPQRGPGARRARRARPRRAAHDAPRGAWDRGPLPRRSSLGRPG